MITKYAWQFFLLSRFVEDICHRLGVAPLPPPSPLESLASLSGPPAPGLANAILAFQQPTALVSVQALTEKERGEIVKILELLKTCCSAIEILKVSGEIERIKGFVTYSPRNEIIIHIRNLTDRIIEDLEEQLFFHVPASQVKYYKQRELFGSEVGKKFPKIAEDITNAGSCFALGQNTACVFHLMRAMEHCVQRFGKKLKITIDPLNASWHDIMKQVHTEINALPGGQRHSRAQNAKKQAFALAAGRLDHVRIVWRNDVMHPKATYDQEEATEVLTSVRAFFVSVEGLL